MNRIFDYLPPVSSMLHTSWLDFHNVAEWLCLGNACFDERSDKNKDSAKRFPHQTVDSWQQKIFSSLSILSSTSLRDKTTAAGNIEV